MGCWNIAAMECWGDRSYSSNTAAKDEAAVRMIDRRDQQGQQQAQRLSADNDNGNGTPLRFTVSVAQGG